jgi:hypothetical protein
MPATTIHGWPRWRNSRSILRTDASFIAAGLTQKYDAFIRFRRGVAWSNDFEAIYYPKRCSLCSRIHWSLMRTH